MSRQAVEVFAPYLTTNGPINPLQQPAPELPTVDLGDLMATLVAEISRHHGEPRVPLPTAGVPIGTDDGRCVRRSVVWFPGNVNHGIGIDDHGRWHQIRAWRHRGPIQEVKFRVDRASLEMLRLAARLVELLPTDQPKES